MNRLLRTLLASALCAGPALAEDPAPAPAGAAAPAASAPSPQIWQGQSGSFQLTWTQAGLSARSGAGAQVFSAAEVAAADFKEYEAGCEAHESWSILSVVGPLLSVRQLQDATCEGAAHPSASTAVLTIDLDAPKKSKSLTDYFSAADLYAALCADGLVKKTLAAANLPVPPDLKSLMQALADNSNDCAFRFESDSLTHFAFHHLEKGKVAVRIGLPYGCEAARGNLTQVGLLLPIPAKLKDALAAAAARKQGFLMKDEKTVAKEQTTQFSVTTPKSKGAP